MWVCSGEACVWVCIGEACVWVYGGEACVLLMGQDKDLNGKLEHEAVRELLCQLVDEVPPGWIANHLLQPWWGLCAGGGREGEGRGCGKRGS